MSYCLFGKKAEILLFYMLLNHDDGHLPYWTKSDFYHPTQRSTGSTLSEVFSAPFVRIPYKSSRVNVDNLQTFSNHSYSDTKEVKNRC